MVHPDFFVYDIVKNSDISQQAAGVGSVFYSNGNIEAEMKYIRAFYATMAGNDPEIPFIPSLMTGRQEAKYNE